ncbi:hypothetical protein A4A49_30298 [Nicotiana attenuata]|uniref:Uncharacterized protein n=1 Tax=Nicotiana attenuata TaxID=49451 RepID=A0A1J6KA89_NICAT|nr:hypothetical protein A4A49_30298 [Nicotiana attenuata]
MEYNLIKENSIFLYSRKREEGANFNSKSTSTKCKTLPSLHVSSLNCTLSQVLYVTVDTLTFFYGFYRTMHTPDSSSYNRRFQASGMYPQHSYRPANHRPYRPGYYASNYELDRPPGNWHKPPNFIVQLRSRSNHRRISRSELNALIEKLPFAPRNSFVFMKGFIFGSLLYDQWSEALEVIVELWRIRLEGGNLFRPWVKRNVEVSSDKDELTERVKLVFLEKLKGLLLVEGELLQKWENKLDLACDEITKLDKLLKNRNNLRV